MRKIIFGGNFDPVHLGHLHMARIARDTFNADVIFVPAKVGVWKEDSIAPEHKIAMLKLAIQDEKRFYIDDFELKQEQQPFSITTIRYFRKRYPKAELFFLIGQDQVNSFHLWKEPEKIAEIAQIIYFERPKLELKLENVQKYHMQALDGLTIDVASSDIRNLKSIAVSENVLSYIEENNLYFIPKIQSYIKQSRYEHSLSVAHLACHLAKIHHLDYQKAYIAGLLHDIAKGIDKDESLSLMKRFYPEYVNMGAPIYHQFLGEMVVKKDFDINDVDILEAIKYHTTGKANMNWLDKIVYSADKIEPTRGYDSSDFIKAIEEDLDQGFLMILKANKEYLVKKNIAISNGLDGECFAYYLND